MLFMCVSGGQWKQWHLHIVSNLQTKKKQLFLINEIEKHKILTLKTVEPANGQHFCFRKDFNK